MTIHLKKALESVNAELESQAHDRAVNIIKSIAAKQATIKHSMSDIEDLKKQLAAISFEPISGETIGL